MSYDDEYVAAAKLGRKIGLDVPFADPCKDRLLNEKMREEIFKRFVQYSGFPAASWVKRVVGQCVATHIYLMDEVERILSSKPALTIGWIEAGGGHFFKCNRKDMLAWLENGIPNPTSANLHVWLTLQSMEIIDFTFVPSYIIINGVNTNEIGYDCGHWTEFSANRRHHPIIVGNDLPQRLGLLGIVIHPV